MSVPDNGIHINSGCHILEFISEFNGQLKVPANRKFSRSISQQDDTALLLHDVSASWTGDPNAMALKNISMRLRKGKLCAIIGAVGSGKVDLFDYLL